LLHIYNDITDLSASETVKLDSLGDSITTATIVKWSKNPGDSVKPDDVIATVDTDKVSVDIKAKHSGVFTKGLADAGAEVL
jgi:pyruvate/2-oxoglutarate dehydrogenase complex dihydrolipoamide acyltransferase (E2) component